MKPLSMDSVKADAESLDKKIERLKTLLEEAEQQRAALMLVIDRYTEKPKKRIRRNENLGILPEQLRGMKLEAALVFIAQKHGGDLNSSASRELLIEAGVLTGKQTGNTLWNTLQLSENFEKVSRGKYRLIDDEEISSSNVVRYARDGS